MGLAEKLKNLGFVPGLVWDYKDGLFTMTEVEGSRVEPPLLYVMLDRDGASVKVGRSLEQAIIHRQGPWHKHLNGIGTTGQVNKPVTVMFKEEVRHTGPITTWVIRMPNRDAAIQGELQLFDSFKGRIDQRRG